MDARWFPWGPIRVERFRLPNLAKGVDAVVYRLIVGDFGVGGDNHQPVPAALVGGEQVAASAQLTQTGLHKHGDHRT